MTDQLRDTGLRTTETPSADDTPRVTPSPDRPVTETDFAWLIERNVVDHTPEWWTGEAGEDWTRDANRAVKFPTNTAAAATKRGMRLGGYTFVSEHGFIRAALHVTDTEREGERHEAE